MHVFQESTLAAEPMSEAEQEKVMEQLERLLETHHFKNSKRYPAVLRFIVEETLAGRGEYLKERLLGVRVFDRPADYDTAADPIVRVTIAEIRKRIAQYYHDEEHDAEMRIELLPGRYAPEFRSRSVRREPVVAGGSHSAEAALPEAALLPSLVEPTAAAAVAAPARASRVRPWMWKGVAALLMVAVLVGAGFLWTRPSALDVLWMPIVGPQRSVLFCIPTDAGKKHGPADVSEPMGPTTSGKVVSHGASGPTFLAFETLGQNIVYSDMLAALQVAKVMAVHHRDYRVRLNVATTFEDLRQGPTVLLGGLDNQWTMQALAPLRFHFAGTDEDRYWIADAEHPGSKAWSLDLKQQFGAVTRDYAIIARIHNEQTGQPEMIIAGIGMSGTAAAGEFLTDEGRVRELKERIGGGFRDRDFEAVLSTDVINGVSGAPKILAVSVW